MLLRRYINQECDFCSFILQKGREQKKIHVLEVKQKGKLFFLAEDKNLPLCPDRDRAAQHLILIGWVHCAHLKPCFTALLMYCI